MSPKTRYKVFDGPKGMPGTRTVVDKKTRSWSVLTIRTGITLDHGTLRKDGWPSVWTSRGATP